MYSCTELQLTIPNSKIWALQFQGMKPPHQWLDAFLCVQVKGVF